jgi:transposase
MYIKIKFQALSSVVRADRRRLAFKKLDEGWSKKEVADLAEVHYKTVETWIRNRKFLEGNAF